MPPPISRVKLALIFDSLRLHVRQQMREWQFVFSAIRLSSLCAKIDNEHVARSPCDIETVDPRNNHIRIGSSVWIWRAEYFERLLFADVECAAFCVAHECDVDVRGEPVRGCDVSTRRGEIGIN